MYGRSQYSYILPVKNLRTMYKFKRKIYRKYEDFIGRGDSSDSEAPEPSVLTIADFNARGEVANPRAPCVVTAIDPYYIKDAGKQRLARKFRMKTDILLLREITRNKFMYYATQEMFLDRKRIMERDNKIYEEAEEFQKFIEESLKKMEFEAFNSMIAEQQKLKVLKENKVAEELNEVKLEHQRVLMEVQEEYGRFKYLLKLTSYFDDSIELYTDDGTGATKLVLPKEIVCMQINERKPAGMEQVHLVQEYMEKVVKPYLEKRNHLNAEIWIKGYERNRMKVSNFNRRFTQLALMNHIVGIMHDKSQKAYELFKTSNVFLKDPEFMQKRVTILQQRSYELLENYEKIHRKDKLSIQLNSTVPVILKLLQSKVHPEKKKKAAAPKTTENASKQWRTLEDAQNSVSDTKNAPYEDEQDTTLAKVEKIQTYVLELLAKLDRIPPDTLRSIEKSVRRRMAKEKEMSRRALVKQNRLHNWMEHFKKHHRLNTAQKQ